MKCPILFVPGNHEDHDYLRSLQRNPSAPGAPSQTFPVDCYQAFHCIQDGHIVRLAANDQEPIRVAGLWGIENTKEGKPYRISKTAVEGLVGLGPGAFDLLLTHDAPAEAYPTDGSVEITRVLRACQPPVHLFGHTSPVNGRHEFSLPNVQTRCWIMEDVYFGKDGRRNLTTSMAILDWDGQEGRVELVRDSWLASMHFKNWQHVWPD